MQISFGFHSAQGQAPRPQSGAAGQAPRSAGQDEEEAEAWETAPDDKLRLKLKDIKCAVCEVHPILCGSSSSWRSKHGV